MQSIFELLLHYDLQSKEITMEASCCETPRAPGLTLAPSAKVFQSPDMTAWAVFFKVQRDHEKDPLMW